MKTSILRNAIFVTAYVANGLAPNAQTPDSIFVAGDDYILELSGIVTAQEAIERSASTFPVSKVMTPQMGQVYRGCAKKAGYNGRVEARARIYSSHYMAVSLVQGAKMTAAQFSTAIACSKRAAAPIVRASTGARSASIYAAPSASFAVTGAKVPQAQKIMAKCVRASGYKKPAQIKVTRYASDFAKVGMVRSGTMTVGQYNKSISCMTTPINAL
jgi:hypothetical protein